MERTAQIETCGPDGDELWRGVIRDHMIGWIEDDGKLRLDVDRYHIPEGQKFDVEKWKESQCCMQAPATRPAWKLLYRIGRALIRHGIVTFHQPEREPLILMCDGTSFVFE